MKLGLLLFFTLMAVLCFGLTVIENKLTWLVPAAVCMLNTFIWGNEYDKQIKN